jgi:NADH-quinone oxidoreductase subunit J
MNLLFTMAAIVAVISTAMVITRTVAVHALLYLIVSLLAIAVVFSTLGAPFAAALEVIIYAGAIMILFVFVVMMLNIDQRDAARESAWLSPRSWIGPAILSGLLVAELIYSALTDRIAGNAAGVIGPKQVGLALFGPYLLAVELASLLLLAGLISAYHLGRDINERGS